MVPAGTEGSKGTVSAARDMMVLRKQSAKTREPAPATSARTPCRRFQRLLRICSTCTRGLRGRVEGRGHVPGRLFDLFAFADGDLAVVFLAQELGERRNDGSAAFCLAGIHGYASA